LLLAGDTPAFDGQGNAIAKKAFFICTKADISQAGAFEKLKKACKYPFEFIQISAEEFEGLEELSRKFFELLGIIRVYAKPPGKPPDMTEPFTLPVGSTVMDLAVDIHRQLAEKLKSARIWGSGVHDGQQVQRNHVLHDKDIIELHFGQ
jgi:ribosome-interacting GTPase 1